MKELKRTRRLTIAAVLFILILAVGLLTLRKPELSYSLSSDEMLEEVYNPTNEMTPDEAMKIIGNENSGFQFIDLRNPYEYDRGALPEAINIPVSDILLPENIDFYNETASDSIILVFYGNTQREANGSWMLLKQLGINNTKILIGGYKYLADANADNFDMSEVPSYSAEEPFIDFSAFMKDISSRSGEETVSAPEIKTIVPVKRKKKVITEGGC